MTGKKVLNYCWKALLFALENVQEVSQSHFASLTLIRAMSQSIDLVLGFLPNYKQDFSFIPIREGKNGS